MRLVLTCLLLSGLSFAQTTVQKIVLYTGTFDPPHKGHVRTLEEALKVSGSNLAIIVPNVTSDHKKKVSSYSDRKKMTELAFRKVPEAKVSDRTIEKAFEEADMEGVRAEIIRRYPEAEIYQVMGNDSYERFLKVTQNKKLPQTTVLMQTRKGETFSFEGPAGTPMMKLEYQDELGLSSTKLRTKIAQGKRPEGLSSEVWDFIKSKRLYDYQEEFDPCSMFFKTLPTGLGPAL